MLLGPYSILPNILQTAFNMCIHQEERAKHLSKFAVATLHASSVLSQQFRLTREQVDNAAVVSAAAAAAAAAVVVVVVVVVFVVASAAVVVVFVVVFCFYFVVVFVVVVSVVTATIY